MAESAAPLPDGGSGTWPLEYAAGAAAALAVSAVLYKLCLHSFGSQAGRQASAPEPSFSNVASPSARQLEEWVASVQRLPRAELRGLAVSDAVLARILFALAYNGACASLDLSRNLFGPLSRAQLGEVLPTAQALRELRLEHCELGEEGLRCLLRGAGGEGEGGEAEVGQATRLDDPSPPSAAPPLHPSTIQTLTLPFNDLGDAGGAALGRAVASGSFPDLRHLDVSRNGLELGAARALGAALARAGGGLESLDASENYFEEESALALAGGLRRSPALRTLRLRGNPLGPGGLRALCAALGERAGGALAELDLGNCGGGSAVGEAAVVLQSSPRLQTLRLGLNDAGNEAAFRLACALSNVPELRCLDLSHAELSAAGARFLAAGLGSCGRLAELNLAANPLGPEGAASLCGALAGAPLRSLDLGWCGLGEGGAAAVAELLVGRGGGNDDEDRPLRALQPSALRSLCLRGNALGPGGARRLADALRLAGERAQAVVYSRDAPPFAPLQELDLSANALGDDGACALAQAFRAAPLGAPERLVLSGNQLSRFGQVALREACDLARELSGREPEVLL